MLHAVKEVYNDVVAWFTAGAYTLYYAATHLNAQTNINLSKINFTDMLHLITVLATAVAVGFAGHFGKVLGAKAESWIVKQYNKFKNPTPKE